MKQKIVLWGLIACIIASNAFASVVINQILYNPINSESGGEAIELYNNGNEDINISKWIIATEASQTDAIIPENTFICAKCYYLIADKNWNQSKDNMSWPEADIETPLTMYNSNSGIALIKNEQTIDAVGWGNPDEITDGLFEQTPADSANEGNSLTRINNADNNKFDFEESIPFFRSSSDLGTGTHSESINIEFEITNQTENPSVSIEFVNLSQRKAAPVPGGTIQITVNAFITGNIDNVTATFAEKTTSMTKSEDSIFSASFSLDYFMPPGTYPILIDGGKEQMTIEFEYLELVAIEISRENINFGKIETEKEHFEEIKIKNIGNTLIDLGIKSDLGSIMEYSFDNNYKTAASNTIISNINLSYGENSETSLKLKLTPNLNTKTGKYDGKIEIIAIGKN